MKESVSNSALKDDKRPIINSGPFTGFAPSVITDTKNPFNFEVGDYVMDRGVYAGRMDKINISQQDKTLTGPFHLFAMPKDIPASNYRSSRFQLKRDLLWSFNSACQYLGNLPKESTLGDWGVMPPCKGRMGCPDLNLRDSLLDYNKNNRGRWALPSLEMLKILCEHQDRGAFAGSFIDIKGLAGAEYLSGQGIWDEDALNLVSVWDFAYGFEWRSEAEIKHQSLRLIRLEPDPDLSISREYTSYPIPDGP